VLEGGEEFFRITKRIHNRLHGALGDGGPLGPKERAHYDRVTQENASAIVPLVSPGDVVVVHDPQPVGLVPVFRSLGATVIWTCHVGIDQRSDVVRSAVEFLLTDVDAADAVTFTRDAYVWTELPHKQVRIIPPCIDTLSPKNISLEPKQQDAILAAAGLFGSTGQGGSPTFTWVDGRTASITRAARITEDGPVPVDAPLVVQVSRWDGLKDPLGVMRAFAEEPGLEGVHLILAGPAPNSVADDPEAVQVLRQVDDFRTSLAASERCRMHLVNVPTHDVDENAVIVNALQRRADVVVQKSLAEGFGLTVTEAMWKARPVVAGRVGGIQDQIDDDVNGILVDPRDLTAFGGGVKLLIDDETLAERFGAAARRRVKERYLVPRYLGAYLELIADLS
jgi:trehalose synthase